MDNTARRLHYEHVKDKRILIVIKPIEKGEQLFEPYGDCFFVFNPYEQRKSILKLVNIDCDCDACKYPHRYEVRENLKVTNKKTMKFGIEMTKEILHLTEKRDFIKIAEIAETLKTKCQKTFSPDDYPNHEWIKMMICFLMSMEALQSRQYFSINDARNGEQMNSSHFSGCSAWLSQLLKSMS